MAPSKKAVTAQVAKPLTQDQIMVITKRIIAEYNSELQARVKKTLQTKEVTDALKAFEKDIETANSVLTKLALKLGEAEKNFKDIYTEYKKSLKGDGVYGYRNYDQYTVDNFDDKFISVFGDQATDDTKRMYVATNKLGMKFAQPIILGGNTQSYKTAIIPGIGNVYEEIVFKSFDSTDAMSLIKELLAKATY